MAVTEQESIVAAAAHSYVREVLVEVTCRDEDGDVVVYTYPFEPAGTDEGGVEPNEEVPERHRDVVLAALAEKDLEPTTDLASPTG